MVVVPTIGCPQATLQGSPSGLPQAEAPCAGERAQRQGQPLGQAPDAAAERVGLATPPYGQALASTHPQIWPGLCHSPAAGARTPTVPHHPPSPPPPPDGSVAKRPKPPAGFNSGAADASTGRRFPGYEGRKYTSFPAFFPGYKNKNVGDKSTKSTSLGHREGSDKLGLNARAHGAERPQPWLQGRQTEKGQQTASKVAVPTCLNETLPHVDEPSQHGAGQKEPAVKGHVEYESPCGKCPTRPICGNTKALRPVLKGDPGLTGSPTAASDRPEPRRPPPRRPHPDPGLAEGPPRRPARPGSSGRPGSGPGRPRATLGALTARSRRRLLSHSPLPPPRPPAATRVPQPTARRAPTAEPQGSPGTAEDAQPEPRGPRPALGGRSPCLEHAAPLGSAEPGGSGTRREARAGPEARSRTSGGGAGASGWPPPPPPPPAGVTSGRGAVSAGGTAGGTGRRERGPLLEPGSGAGPLPPPARVRLRAAPRLQGKPVAARTFTCQGACARSSARRGDAV
ncbi:collagen alpha-1(VII) chain-like [Lynx canadensis]|uniref:collagen alpha-1(VII) chain-like n=1 Tax=Lynx canadensis TaxID=61383 RepID=UPI0011AFF2F1|nr:collagen alpha-1(VII) chain-like [Lynx canadensis]